MMRVSKNVRFEWSCKLCKKYGGTHTTQATKDCHKYENDRAVKANFRAAKKASKKPDPAKQSFAQLSEKLEHLEKTLNSLTAIDGHDRQYFNELRSTVFSCLIFIRSQSLIAR
jgi:hypothetical protein